MHPFNTRCRHAALLVGAATISAAALAQNNAPAEPAAPAAPSASPLTLNVGLGTDYRYRGISQTRLKPALSAGADYTHASGWYVGTWLSSIRWIKDAGGRAPIEWDIYGGYRGTAGPLSYDLGVLRYQYPGHDLGVSPNTTEVYGALSWKVFTAKYSHATSNLFGFANSQGSGYLDLSANIALSDGWSVVPHIGRQWLRRNSAYSYTDYALMLNKDFGKGLTANIGVVGTNADKALYVTPAGRFSGRTALMAGVKYTF